MSRKATATRTPTRTVNLPERLFGVTIDNVSNMRGITDAIDRVKSQSPARAKPIVRVVFDFDEDGFEENRYRYSKDDFKKEVAAYKEAISELKKGGRVYVMGEIVDSSAVWRCHFDPDPTRTYAERTKAYVEGLGSLVDIWEIGNEVNGEWVGWKEGAWSDPSVTIEMMAAARARVAKEIRASFDTVKRINRDALTAITFYYNADTARHCWTDELKKNSSGALEAYGQHYDMLAWAHAYRKELPDVDYVFISYYEDDCEGVRPNRGDMDTGGLLKTLKELAGLFAPVKIGFGEFGPQCTDVPECRRRCRSCLQDQVSFISRYYVELDERIRRAVSDPATGWDSKCPYVGGYFYWYFKQDLVNNRNENTIKAMTEAFKHWHAPGPRAARDKRGGRDI
jgi:hypothetical protein